MNNKRAQHIYLGTYGKEIKFRNLNNMKQITVRNVGQPTPAIGTVCTLIFGSTVRVLWEQKTTMRDHARTIELAMSEWGQARTQAKLRRVLAESRASYRNSLKYGYCY